MRRQVSAFETKSWISATQSKNNNLFRPCPKVFGGGLGNGLFHLDGNLKLLRLSWRGMPICGHVVILQEGLQISGNTIWSLGMLCRFCLVLPRADLLALTWLKFSRRVGLWHLHATFSFTPDGYLLNATKRTQPQGGGGAAERSWTLLGTLAKLVVSQAGRFYAKPTNLALRAVRQSLAHLS
eukprot:7143041-Karenia_brevis.AAC.1